MSLSVFLARIIGPYFFLIGLAMLVHQTRFKRVVQDLLVNPVLIVFSGTIALIAGVMIVVDHNIWIPHWPLLITLVGWLLLIQGVMRLFTPDAYTKISKDMSGYAVYTFLAWIRLAVGTILIWAGFFQV